MNPSIPSSSMGNTTSIAGRDCLVSALGGNAGLVAFQNQPLYQTTAVHEYNLNIPVTPAAITYPETAEQIAAVVKCASQYDYKVQARSGGHSFGNYGKLAPRLTCQVPLPKTPADLQLDSRTWRNGWCRGCRYEILQPIFDGRSDIRGCHWPRDDPW